MAKVTYRSDFELKTNIPYLGFTALGSVDYLGEILSRYNKIYEAYFFPFHSRP